MLGLMAIAFVSTILWMMTFECLEEWLSLMMLYFHS